MVAQAKFDDEPRTTRRGRPRKKGPDESEPVQARRARMRRAQEAFRNRQKAAQDAEKQLLTKQEATINQMSSAFVDFVDFLLHSKEIQQDSDLMHKLHATIRHFVTANESENARDGAEDEAPVITTIATTEKQSTKDLPLISSSSSPASPPEDIPIETIFGNGWPSTLPTSFLHLDPWNPSQTTISPFSRNLIYYTLSIAYQCLSGSPGFPLELAQRIFRFSLLLHSKEELLFNLRWFLGPGNQELIRLAYVSFQSANLEDVPEFVSPEGSPNMPALLPAVDIYATDMTPVKEEGGVGIPSGPFMNAREVEQYLYEKGAKFLDAETIEISLPDAFPRSGSEGLQGLFPLQPASSVYSATSSSTAASDDILMDEDIFPTDTSNDIDPALSQGAWDLFNWDDVSGEPTINPDILALPLQSSFSQYEHTKPQQKQQGLLGASTRRLQTSVLFRNLACIGLCLSKGPGYLREYIDHAIFWSVVQ